jgi:hypothetical protein
MFGDDGEDHVSGGQGNDGLWGGLGNDNMDGGDGDDLIYGGPGDEGNLSGYPGKRSITGDAGDDIMVPGPGEDAVYGEEGFNHIIARSDGSRDNLYCSFIADDQQGNGLLTFVGPPDDLRKQLDDVRKCDVELLTEEEFVAKYPAIDLSLV